MNDYEDLFGMVIGLVSAVLSLTIPIIYIITRSRRQQRSIELLHAERMAAIERGMELPASPLELVGDQIANARKPRTALLPGLVWFFVGIAIVISRLTYNDAPPLMIGLIPAGIGLAYLIYYFVEERKPISDKDATNR